MGAEETRVLLFPKSAMTREIVNALRATGPWHDARTPSADPTCENLELDDGEHLIEAEVQDMPPRLSLRFALCNPETVDTIFVGLVSRLARMLDAQVRVVGASELAACSFSSPDLHGLDSALQQNIEDERKLWQQEFGGETLKATCEEAVVEFILRRRGGS